MCVYMYIYIYINTHIHIYIFILLHPLNGDLKNQIRNFEKPNKQILSAKCGILFNQTYIYTYIYIK